MSLKQEKEPTAKNTNFDYLLISLYLVILSFFILLNNLSEVNNKKSDAITDKIRREFDGKNIVGKFTNSFRDSKDSAIYLGEDRVDLWVVISNYLYNLQEQLSFVVKPPLKSDPEDKMVLEFLQTGLFNQYGLLNKRAEAMIAELNNIIVNNNSQDKVSFEVILGFSYFNYPEVNNEKINAAKLKEINILNEIKKRFNRNINVKTVYYDNIESINNSQNLHTKNNRIILVIHFNRLL